MAFELFPRLTSSDAGSYLGATELVNAYAHAIDSGTPEQIGELFAEEGLLRVHGGEEFRGAEEIKSFFVRSRANRASTGVRLRHHITSVRARVLAPDRAAALSYFIAVSADHGPDHWGTYKDVLVQREGIWLFLERRVTLEGADPAGWIGTGGGSVKL